MANTKKQARQERAAKRLDAQLASGVRNIRISNWAGVLTHVTEPLTEKNIARIKKERAILKERTGK